MAAKVDEERGQDRSEQSAGTAVRVTSLPVLGVLWHSAELELLISLPQSGKHKPSAFLLSACRALRGEYSSCASATPESV